MSVNVWPSEITAHSPLAKRQRAIGKVLLSAQRLEGRTRPMRVAESGSMRIRLPRGSGEGLDAVIVNTAGGIACGDRFEVEIEAAEGASIAVATPAAEKVYRSDGPVSHVLTRLTVGPQARIEWLPQETILFDHARLSRRLDACMAENGSLSIFEAVVFGRATRSEIMSDGLFSDHWRIRRGGRLIYADTFRLAGPISHLLKKPTIANDARAVATFLYVGPDAEARLEAVRASLTNEGGGEAAASAWNGLLAVRFSDVTIERLRVAATRFLVEFRAAPLPRVWLS